MKIKHLQLCGVCAVAALWSCAEPEIVTIFRDAPVVFDGDGDRVTQVDMALGQLVDGRFVPVEEGDPVEVIDGFQGGTWVHLSIRVAGLEPDGVVEARLGEISEVRFGLRLTRTPEGYLEAHDIPMPVPLSDEDIAALEGQRVTLEASFSSAEQSVTQARGVTLRRATP